MASCSKFTSEEMIQASQKANRLDIEQFLKHHRDKLSNTQRKLIETYTKAENVRIENKIQSPKDARLIGHMFETDITIYYQDAEVTIKVKY